jgi:hypothetical protein
LNFCLTNRHIFSWGRKPEQTGIALDHVSSKAGYGRVTREWVPLFCFPYQGHFFPFSLEIKFSGSLAILADLSFCCCIRLCSSPPSQWFDRTRLILAIMVRNKLIASREDKACLSPSPYGLKLNREIQQLKP